MSTSSVAKSPSPLPTSGQKVVASSRQKEGPLWKRERPHLARGGPSGQQGPAHPQRCDTEACGMLRPPSGVPCSSHRLQHGGPDRHGGRTPTGREEPLTCLLGQTPAVHEAPLSPLHGSGILKVSDPSAPTSKQSCSIDTSSRQLIWVRGYATREAGPLLFSLSPAESPQPPRRLDTAGLQRCHCLRSPRNLSLALISEVAPQESRLQMRC